MTKLENRKEFKTMFQVGKISCNLLHDLISPITSLSLYVETVKDENLKEIIEPVKESSEDIRKFIRLIQDAVEKPNKEYVINVNKTIEHAVFLGRHKMIQNNVSVVIVNKTKPDLKIKCKKLEFYQLIMNLVGNSVDSFKKINRKNKRVNIIIEQNKKTGYLILTICDNGCGIPSSIRNKIFEKDFTTKESGMGVGLNTVKKIIEGSFNGQIILKSQVGKGTEFKLKMKIK